MAVDMFLKLNGIKGEAQDDKHKDEIDVLSWSWGASQGGTMHAGTGGGAGKVHVQDLTVTKWVDVASSPIYNAIAGGKHIQDATLTVRKAGEKPLEYLIIKMTDVIVTSWHTGGSGGEDRLTENVTLNFAKVNVKYVQQNKDGSAGASPEVNHDIAANKVG
ncbi:MAG TPA: type VI secretion system tube protein Hcp [Caulobacteraceae bacterium]|nr:type VI secretion system tube protein Hcp [Caulobacteraceae bacterium]